MLLVVAAVAYIESPIPLLLATNGNRTANPAVERALEVYFIPFALAYESVDVVHAFYYAQFHAVGIRP
ncbi:MAG TPA: hypothetical protein VM165_08355 [Planctomycetaceae bacterium]|nr:hypothetical protein [Planctomycetaceae bacterium]